MESDIATIMINWNAKAHLANCLDSLSKTGDGYSREIVVVDNGSTDGSCELVKERFPDVTLIQNDTNLGFARANNIAIRASDSRYVCLVNSDIIVQDGCIEKLLRFMDDNPNVGMAGPRILNPDGTLQVSCRHFPSIWNNLCQVFGLNYLFPGSRLFAEPLMKYWAHDTTRTVDVLSGCFWIVRREALDRVGLLDEDFFFYGEDVDWCRRFRDAGWDVVFYPEAAAIHDHAASSKKDPIRFFIELHKADLQYWQKHHGRIGRWIYVCIILLRHGLRLPLFAAVYFLRPGMREQTHFKIRRNWACLRWLALSRYGHAE